MEVQILNILILIYNNILMLISVVLDGVFVLHSDICLKPNSCLHSIQVHAQAPLSNSSKSMCIIVFNVAGPATYLCMMSTLMGKFGLGEMCINSLKYESSSSQTYFFFFTWLGVLIDGITCVCTTMSILLNTHAWEACMLMMNCGSF